MWLFTQIGFFSVVRKSADEVHVRARCREDLEALVHAIRESREAHHRFPEPVASHPGSDYPWRIIVQTSADLALVMSALAASIDYANFKSAIAARPSQAAKVHAYHDIHRRMVEWQHQKAADLDAEIPGSE